MLKIGTAELKNQLSKYLSEVKKGMSLIVTDHGRPVAKIVPISQDEPDSDLLKIAALTEAGTLSYNFNKTGFDKPNTLLDIGSDVASSIVIEDRE